MRMRFPQVLFGICCCSLLAWAPTSFGEEKKPAAVDSVSLDQIPDLLRKNDEAVKTKAEAMIVAVEAEVAAKRVSPMISQGLRWSLQTMNASGVNAQTLMASTTVPLNIPAVANAANALQDASDAAQAQRAVIFRQALPAIERRLTELTLTAKSSSEIEPVLVNVELVSDLAQQRVRSSATSRQMNALSNCVNFLHTFSQLLNSHPSDDASSLSQTLRKFNGAGQAAEEFVAGDAVRKRVMSVLEPMKSAAATAQLDLIDALIARKPYAEVSAALTAYETAANRYAAVGNVLDINGPRQATNRTNAYQSLASLARSVETHQWNEVKQGLGNVKQSIRQLDDKDGAKLEELLGKWDQESRESFEAAARALSDAIHAKLSAIKKPADLDAAAAEVAKMEGDLRRNQEADPVQGLSDQLASMSAVWIGRNPNFFAEGGFNGRVGSTSQFATDLALLQSRIERDLAARALRAPELREPPLADEPLDNALNDLCEKLAAGGEWRRLLKLLEGINGIARTPLGLSRGADTISSIRAYLAGQNFELAEQWTDAASAYKTVLRNAADSSPVKESALRLKAIAKDHPNEVKAASVTPFDDPQQLPPGR